jgi:pimeloyl-ACP methyl ester carboxylesterase
MTIEENRFTSKRHTTSYLSSGPPDGPLLIFVHGWPELSFSWRHQIEFFGAAGWRVIAPDMRGYGRSSVYDSHSAYAQSEIVTDMLELLEHLGGDKAVWVGHDWGAPVVWNMGLHHADKVRAIANLCVPLGFERGVEELIKHVDRNIYPIDKYPKGQWDYQYFYMENFELAQNEMESDPYKVVKALFRKKMGEEADQPVFSATIRERGGWFPPDGTPPDMRIDLDVVSEEEAQEYANALTRTGFFGANSWYMNHERNSTYDGELSLAQRTLHMPVLFVHAENDYICYTIKGGLAEPMREACTQLIEKSIQSGHWMAQEKPEQLNVFLLEWLEHL